MITAVVNKIIWRELIEHDYRVLLRLTEFQFENGKMIKGKRKVDYILDDYKAMVAFGTQELYLQFLKDVENACEGVPMFVEYIEGFKEDFSKPEKVFECISLEGGGTYLRTL